MRNTSRGLDRESEVIRHLRNPGLKDTCFGQAVESVINLDGTKPLRIKLEHFCCRQSFRVEMSFPLFVAISARAGEDPHRTMRSSSGLAGAIQWTVYRMFERRVSAG